MNWNAANNWRSEIEAGLQHGSKEGLRFANALLIGAGSLTGLVWAAYVLAGYHAGFIALNHLGALLPESLLHVLTSFGDALVALALLALLARSHPRLIIVGILSALFATALSHGLKNIFDAARPLAALNTELYVVGPALKRLSFPSGHTTAAFTLVSVFAVASPSHQRWLLFALASLVGLSRVLVGVHWPLDVVMGAACGMASVGLALRLTDGRPMRGRSWFASYLLSLIIAAGSAIALLLVAPEYPLATPALHVLGIAILAHLVSANFLADRSLPSQTQNVRIQS